MDKTTDIVRTLLRTHFSTNQSGVPGKQLDSAAGCACYVAQETVNFIDFPIFLQGNDDSGAEGSFVVWSMMGFYPVSGTDVYLLSSPLFPETSLQLGREQSFTIVANNLTETNRYIQKATLNGLPFERSWFRHGEITTALDSKLELDMGAQWTGFGAEGLPPSISGNVPWV
jgi:putative alpha-1,2-mannosidase